MQFFKTNNIYKIIRITGGQDNILGISFRESNSSENDLEIIEWDYDNIDRRKTKISKQQIREEVLSGLQSVNKSLQTNYKLSKIYFAPFDNPNDRIYEALISVLIKHYHNGHEFKEV
jgi:hypothetical protein